MLEVLIRPFQERDLASVMSLIQREFGEVFRPDLYTSISQAWPEGFLVAEAGQGLLGALIGIHDAPLTGRVLIMVVDKAVREHGIGSRMMEIFTQRCFERSFRSISLEVRASNERAQGFYRRHGFRGIATLARYYNDGEDGIRMERMLY